MDDDKMILDDSDLFCPDILSGGLDFYSDATGCWYFDDAVDLSLPNNLTVGHALAALVALAHKPQPGTKAQALAFLKNILSSLE